MTYRELFPTASEGIFTNVFKKDFAELYSTLFGTIDSAQLDVYTHLKYGERNMLPYITVDDYSTYVGAIITLYSDSWKKVNELLSKEYDPLNPTVKETTDTKTVTVNTTNNNESLTAKKTFNDGEFNDSDRDTTESTLNRQDDEDTKHIESGLGSGTLFSTIIQKEKGLREDDYKKQIIAQLIDLITLEIY